MLAPRIIPCLDVDQGKVVKGIKFVDIKTVGDPVAVAAEYDRQNADELVLLDITASHEERDIMYDVVRRTAETIFIPFTVGGGLRNVEDIRAMLAAGADKISINTSAVLNPDLVEESAKRFGTQCTVVAVDAKRRDNNSWEVYTHGGRNPTGRDAVEWVREVEQRGAGEILLTSMDRDGTKDGFDLELTRAVSDAISIPVIASGGAGTVEHLRDGILKGGAQAVLAASIFHYKEMTVQQVKMELAAAGIPVRL